MYWFLEVESKKGGNSVVSLLYNAISKMIKPETTEITLYSDSAPGQNKNTTMIRFCLWLAETFNVVITHMFPVRGHSY